MGDQKGDWESEVDQKGAGGQPKGSRGSTEGKTEIEQREVIL